MSGRSLDPEFVAEVIGLFLDGKSRAEIVKETGVTYSRVGSALASIRQSMTYDEWEEVKRINNRGAVSRMENLRKLLEERLSGDGVQAAKNQAEGGEGSSSTELPV